MRVTKDRRLHAKETLRWGSYRLGLLSVTLSFHWDGGLMYSQASVMPVNAGDSATHVIEKSEK